MCGNVRLILSSYRPVPESPGPPGLGPFWAENGNEHTYTDAENVNEHTKKAIYTHRKNIVSLFLWPSRKLSAHIRQIRRRRVSYAKMKVGIWSLYDVFVSRDMTTYVTYQLLFMRHASRFAFVSCLYLQKYRWHMVKS